MNNVIIGAGQCGRGYIARLLTLSKESFTFIDEDEELIHQLQEQAQYNISFCGSDRKTITIRDYEAFSWSDPECIWKLAEADLIVTSVGEQCLPSLITPIKQALKQRIKKGQPIILTAENGTAPKQQLLALQKHAELSESVIFCTTLKQPDSLDIMSEDLDYLPYDRACLHQDINVFGMKQEYQFRDLLERKIYTYNSLSACVCYLGDYLGYECYGDAANDKGIRSFLDVTKKQVDVAISSSYQIAMEEQQEFSNMAITKFTNRSIIDTIDRNARDVKRKLGTQERILAPIRLIREHNGNPSCFYLVCAAALWYGEKTNTFSILDEQVKREWEYSCKDIIVMEDRIRIEHLFMDFKQGKALSEIMQEAGL